MGGAISGNGLFGSDGFAPNPPKNLIPDPDIGAQISVVVNKLPGRDKLGYAVHSAEHSSKGGEGMWIWFNKYQSPNGKNAIIDLENFIRGKDQANKDKSKGGVLYRATMNVETKFEKFFRIAGRGTGKDAFQGFLGDKGRAVLDDIDYIMHSKHHCKRKDSGRDLAPKMITKWRYHSKSYIDNGNLGRSDALRNGNCVLEMVAVGTVVTTWQEEDRIVNHFDSDGEITGHHNERRTLKHETEFVDRIEYRLILNDKLWAEWMAIGDSLSRSQDVVNIITPFFNTEISNGEVYSTRTLDGIDGPFALMLSHVCCSELFINSIKKNIQCGTPILPPITFTGWGSNDIDLTFTGLHFAVEMEK